MTLPDDVEAPARKKGKQPPKLVVGGVLVSKSKVPYLPANAAAHQSRRLSLQSPSSRHRRRSQKQSPRLRFCESGAEDKTASSDEVNVREAAGNPHERFRAVWFCHLRRGSWSRLRRRRRRRRRRSVTSVDDADHIEKVARRQNGGRPKR